MSASGSRRVALVTAAAAGLGRGIVAELTGAGYRVAFTYRPGGTSPAQTIAAARPFGDEPLAVAADAARRGATRAAVREVEERLGRLDVVVHAAGPIVVRSFANSTMDDYDRLIEANLGSSVELAFAALPGMRERRFGRIVYFGMNGSNVTQPAANMAIYGAAKAGVVTFARALALEEGRHGITVNVIEPGDIRDKTADRLAARATEAANPTHRAGSWQDVADVVRFVVRDESDFLSGMVLGVNGGLVAPHE